MPSCKPTAHEKSKKTKYKAPRVIIPIKKTKPRKKPEVHVNESSSPEEMLHASWEFISAFQFFSTFNAYFRLPKGLSIEQLEEALLAGKEEEQVEDEHLAHSKRESSVLSQQSSPSGTCQPVQNYLANFMVHIISPLLTQRQKTLINNDNYEQFIADVFPDYRNFADMHILDKIKVLKSIEMAHVEIADPDLLALQIDKSSRALRFAPLGTDREGWVYWYFGDYRLYREMPLSIGKKGPTMSDTLGFTFELICSTIEQWKEFIEKLQSVKRASNKGLTKAVVTVGSEVIAKLEAKEEARMKHEAKLKRAIEVELMPKKRSRRLEAKFDEQVKKQKLSNGETVPTDMEEPASCEKKAEKAKPMMGHDRKEILSAESLLRKEIYGFIMDLIVTGQETKAAMKPLTTFVNSKTTEQQGLEKMQGWIKLLEGSVSMEMSEEDGEIRFVGESVNTAFGSILFKSTMMVYLKTLLLFMLNPISVAYETTDQLYGDLVLGRLDGIESFSLTLNNVIASITDISIREGAIRLLSAVFLPDSLQMAEGQQHEQEIEGSEIHESNTIVNGVDQLDTPFSDVSEMVDSTAIASGTSELYNSVDVNELADFGQTSADVKETDNSNLTLADSDAVSDNHITSKASLQTFNEITAETAADPQPLETASLDATAELQTPEATSVDDDTGEKPDVGDSANVKHMGSVAWLDSVNTTDSLKISTESSVVSLPQETL
ncbi:hypothetical protein BD408DRAFT_398869 [Parasitella parasitica]|nr:hypothetical protein BD408DRAFT_398869 [Parasitella parasitica]